MIISIPVSLDLPAFVQRSTLDGVPYLLTFQWNEREPGWYLSVADRTGAPLMQGIKIVPNWPLFRRFPNTIRPAGELIAFDPQRSGGPVLLEDMGRRIKMLYAEQADLADLGIT